MARFLSETALLASLDHLSEQPGADLGIIDLLRQRISSKMSAVQRAEMNAEIQAVRARLAKQMEADEEHEDSLAPDQDPVEPVTVIDNDDEPDEEIVAPDSSVSTEPSLPSAGNKAREIARLAKEHTFLSTEATMLIGLMVEHGSIVLSSHSRRRARRLFFENPEGINNNLRLIGFRMEKEPTENPKEFRFTFEKIW